MGQVDNSRTRTTTYSCWGQDCSTLSSFGDGEFVQPHSGDASSCPHRRTTEDCFGSFWVDCMRCPSHVSGGADSCCPVVLTRYWGAVGPQSDCSRGLRSPSFSLYFKPGPIYPPYCTAIRLFLPLFVQSRRRSGNNARENRQGLSHLSLRQ